MTGTPPSGKEVAGPADSRPASTPAIIRPGGEPAPRLCFWRTATLREISTSDLAAWLRLCCEGVDEDEYARLPLKIRWDDQTISPLSNPGDIETIVDVDRVRSINGIVTFPDSSWLAINIGPAAQIGLCGQDDPNLLADYRAKQLLQAIRNSDAQPLKARAGSMTPLIITAICCLIELMCCVNAKSLLFRYFTGSAAMIYAWLASEYYHRPAKPPRRWLVTKYPDRKRDHVWTIVGVILGALSLIISLIPFVASLLSH